VARIADVLFPPADYRRTTVSLLAWWESRRTTFNVVVGATGILTLIVIRAISLIPPGVFVPLDWRPVVAYGILANVCYTFGFMAEATAQRAFGEKCPAFGPALFRQGLAFSVGLTLLPILLVSMGWLLRVGMWIFG
jgi:hypothetical protein